MKSTFLFVFLRRLSFKMRESAKRHGFFSWYHPVYAFFRRGVYPLLRPRGIHLIALRDFKIYVNGEDRVIAADLMTYENYEKEEVDLMIENLAPAMRVIDLGANIGYYALKAAQKVGPQGKVYAFEPDPVNFSLLCRNAEINHFTQIIPVSKMVSDKTETRKLFLSAKNLGAHTGIEGNVMMGRGGSRDVEAVSLDHFFKTQNETRVDFIKMDVQGMEGRVLRGASELLKNNPRLKILMEFWPGGLKNAGEDPGKMLEDLKALGFEIKALHRGQLKKYQGLENLIEMMLAEGKDYINLFMNR